MYQKHLLNKSYYSNYVIPPYTAVKFDTSQAADYVMPAVAATDLIIGVVNELGFTALDVTNGSNVDVVLDGIVQLSIGAAVIEGQRLTINASGQGILAAPAAGANAQVIGIALSSGSTSDVIPVLLRQSVMQG